MSRCYIIEFKDGKPDTEHEFQNAWGGAARIWDALYNKYLRDPNKQFDSWMGQNNSPLWKLAKNPALSRAERAVHAATFDYATIERENFKRYASDLREFAKLYSEPKRVDHLPDWAALIEKCEAEAIGFHATSVCSNPWYAWDEEADESIPYDLNTGERHFEVYAYLDEDSPQ